MNAKFLWSPWGQGNKSITYSVFSQLETFPFVVQIKTKLFYAIRYICLLVKKQLLEQVTRSKAFCSFHCLWSALISFRNVLLFVSHLNLYCFWREQQEFSSNVLIFLESLYLICIYIYLYCKCGLKLFYFEGQGQVCLTTAVEQFPASSKPSACWLQRSYAWFTLHLSEISQDSSIRSTGLWRRYNNMTITILDIIHRPVFYLKLYSIGLFVPHRKRVTSPLRAQ
jgi:hypothetical protein